MPVMSKIEVNPDFKPDGKEQTEALKEAKRIGPKTVSYQSGLEAVRLSGGMYRVTPDKKPMPVIPAPPAIAEMERNDLLSLALSLGMKTDKAMKRSEIVAFVETRMNKIEILDEDTDD